MSVWDNQLMRCVLLRCDLFSSCNGIEALYYEFRGLVSIIMRVFLNTAKTQPVIFIFPKNQIPYE